MHEHLLWIGQLWRCGRHLLAEYTQQVARLAIGELHIRREIAVQGMGNLIDVIADAAQLLQQGRVHRLWSARGFDLAIADQPFTKTGYAQTGAAGIDGTAQMLIGREPYRDGLAARSSRVCPMPRHPSGLIKVGFGAREPRPDRRGPGEWRSTLPGEWDLQTIAA